MGKGGKGEKGDGLKGGKGEERKGRGLPPEHHGITILIFGVRISAMHFLSPLFFLYLRFEEMRTD